MSVLSRAELLLQAKNYSGAGDWLDESGNGHDAQFGSLLAPDTNDPLDLASTWTGVQHVHLPGIAGNYPSAPNSAALSITGDIDIQARVAPPDWTPATEMAIVSKFTTAADQRSYMAVIRSGSTGLLRLYWSENGIALLTGTSSVAPTVSNGDYLWIRFTLDVNGGAGGAGRVTFYTGGSGTSPTWVQLGDTADAGSAPTSIFDGSAPVEIGTYDGGSAGLLQAEVTNARIYSDITETTLEFDADFTDRTAVTEPFATFTEGSPNAATVTFNRTAAGRKLTVVDRALFLLGTDDFFDIADDAGLDFAAGESFTILVSFRTLSTTDNARLIDKRGNVGTGYLMAAEAVGDGYLLFIFASGDNTVMQGDTSLGSGVASIFVGRRDVAADELEVFMNGVSDATAKTDTTTTTLASARSLFIGKNASMAQDYIDAEIFAVVLWREALTNDEIALAGDELLGLKSAGIVRGEARILPPVTLGTPKAAGFRPRRGLRERVAD